MSADVDEAAMADVAGAVKSGQCILFLGAGVHHGPPDESDWTYPEDFRPPLGRELSEQLASECADAGQQLPDEMRDLRRTSLLYEKTFSRNRLVDTIRAAVQTGKKASPVLCGLAELDFRLVASTNFDELFEDALRSRGKRPDVSRFTKDPHDPVRQYAGAQDPTREEPFIFKMHGDVGARESIVITDEDYIEFIFRMSDTRFDPMPNAFRFRFQTWPTLFVGYSLMDPNLRVLLKTLRWGVDSANFPDAYAVDLMPDPLIVFFWRQYVKFIVEDVWAFVPKLYSMVRGTEMPNRCGV